MSLVEYNTPPLSLARLKMKKERSEEKLLLDKLRIVPFSLESNPRAVTLENLTLES